MCSIMVHMTPWVFVILISRLSHSLNVYPLNRSEEFDVTNKQPSRMPCIQNGCPADHCYCVATVWSNCVRGTWICDGMRDCDNGEDEEECGVKETDTNVVTNRYHEDIFSKGTLEAQANKALENLLENLWTFFIMFLIIATCCLTGKKGRNLETPPPELIIEQCRPQGDATYASQQLPYYYLHTLHRSPCTPPTTAIQQSDPGGNAEAAYSSAASNQARNDVSVHCVVSGQF